MTTRLELAGHCYCGEVRYAIDMAPDEQPIFTAYCHCDLCRRAHAAPLYHVATIDQASFQVTAGQEHIKEIKLGGPTRAFTTCCGTRIYNTFGGWTPGGRTPLAFFPNTLDEATQQDLPERLRPQKMNRPDECVLDTEFLKRLPRLA